jgi:hypothetical protein
MGLRVFDTVSIPSNPLMVKAMITVSNIWEIFEEKDLSNDYINFQLDTSFMRFHPRLGCAKPWLS